MAYIDDPENLIRGLRPLSPRRSAALTGAGPRTPSRGGVGRLRRRQAGTSVRSRAPARRSTDQHRAAQGGDRHLKSRRIDPHPTPAKREQRGGIDDPQSGSIGRLPSLHLEFTPGSAT